MGARLVRCPHSSAMSRRKPYALDSTERYHRDPYSHPDKQPCGSDGHRGGFVAIGWFSHEQAFADASNAVTTGPGASGP